MKTRDPVLIFVCATLAMALFVGGLAAVFASALGPARADSPTSAVVLTVAGNLAHANRPPFDGTRDSFLGYHEQEFDRAFEFNLAMLEGLGTVEARIEWTGWDGPIVFSGPRLGDVLAAAGCADGGPITTLALDGFGTEIAAADVGARDWVLSTRANGRLHSIGGRGPLWLVFDPPGDRPATDDEELSWPWALFFIRC